MNDYHNGKTIIGLGDDYQVSWKFVLNAQVRPVTCRSFGIPKYANFKYLIKIKLILM
jgi:hypothetical protein